MDFSIFKWVKYCTKLIGYTLKDFSAFFLILGHNIAMPLKSLMKNPVLVIGVLMMFIFLYQTGKKLNWWEQRRKKLMPSSCQAVLVKLERRIPANWHADCEGQTYNNLAVEIKYPQESDAPKEPLQKVRALLYREMANDLISVAKNSPDENLERTNIVRMKLMHPQMEINAITEGRFITKLKTLTDKSLIAQHLKVTVQVRESLVQ